MEAATNPSWQGRAGYVEAGERQIFCFVHEPEEEEQRSTAVLFCGPFGWDEMVSHRPIRTWAERLAQAGHPTVRFDLPTTGDSDGDWREPDRVLTWTAGTRAMIDWVPERFDAGRLAVIGIGLGGLLAWSALVEGAAVDDLLLWGVPASGRALLREQRAYARMIAAGYAAEHRSGERGPDDPEELTGYALTPATAAELEALAPARQRIPTAPRRVLLLGRDELPVPEAQRAAFDQTGCDLEVQATGDFAALLALPYEARLPTATIDRSIAWLAAGDPVRNQCGPRARHERPSAELVHGRHRVREEAIEIELGAHRVSGVLTAPVDAPPVLTALLLSAGALRRTGVSRVWVEFARRWAARGVVSIRLDHPGIGDSSGDERSLVGNAALYRPESTQVVLDVMAWAAARELPQRFVPVGSCSGAYWALHSALADERVVAAAMLTLWAFEWSDDLVAERSTGLALGALRSRLWHRLLRRDITLAEMWSKLRSITPGRVAGRVSASAERREHARMVEALDTLRDHGTDALFVVHDGQALIAQLCPDGRTDALDRWPNVTLEHLGSPDNLFRALALQQRVARWLDESMDRVLGTPDEPGARSILHTDSLP